MGHDLNIKSKTIKPLGKKKLGSDLSLHKDFLKRKQIAQTLLEN